MSNVVVDEVAPETVGPASADVRYLYVIHEDGDETCCKVGRARHPEWRRMELQSGNHRRLVLFKVWRINSRAATVALESYVHSLLSKRAMRGEWFRVSPAFAADTVLSVLEEWKIV